MCKAEQKTALKYNVDISLSPDGEVIHGSCECPAGGHKCAHCKHFVATLLGLIDAFEKKPILLNETSTQKLQTFHQPAKPYFGSPIKAREMTDKITLNLDSENDNSENDKLYQEYFLNVIKARGFNNNMSIKQITYPANPFGFVNDHCYLKHDVEHDILKSLSLVDICQEDVERIESESFLQNKSEKWHYYRNIRLTSSNFQDICNDENDEQKIQTYVKSYLDPKKFSNKATVHGQIYEKVAIKQFEDNYLKNKFAVQKCGLFIMLQHPYIGSSPDGLLGKNAVVEVKCPYSSKDVVADEKTVPYLYRNSKNELALKENHQYYFQVQGQMMVTNRSLCFFLVYTFKSLVIINVYRDNNFIQDMLKKLNKFYHKYMKPAILNKFFYRDYDKIFASKKEQLVEKTMTQKKFFNVDDSLPVLPKKIKFVKENVNHTTLIEKNVVVPALIKNSKRKLVYPVQANKKFIGLSRCTAFIPDNITLSNVKAHGSQFQNLNNLPAPTEISSIENKVFQPPKKLPPGLDLKKNNTNSNHIKLVRLGPKLTSSSSSSSTSLTSAPTGISLKGKAAIQPPNKLPLSTD